MPDPKNTIKTKSKETFDMQRNIPDQIWVALLEDAREEVKSQANNLPIQEREHTGVPAVVGQADQDTNGLFDEMTESLKNSFADRDSGLLSMQYLAFAYAKIAEELAKEAKKIEDGIPAEDDKKQIKSRFIMEQAVGPAMRMAASFKKMKNKIDAMLDTYTNKGSVYQEEFEKTLEQMKGHLTPEEQKGFFIMDKVLKGKLSDPEDEKKIENWIADKGQDQAAGMAKKNLKACYRGFTNLLTGKTRVYTTLTPGVDEYLERKREKDTGYLSAAIEELESTGGGKNWDKAFGIHISNSKEYEKMLSSIKSYQKALKEHASGHATAYRQNMVDNCLKYIEGKEKVRTHAFGRMRFDAVMTILHKQLDPHDFERLLDIINTKRKVTRDDEDYLQVDKFENKLSTYQQRGNQMRQEQTKEYALSMTQDTCGRMEAVDAVYGIKPVFLPNFYILDETGEKARVVCFTPDQFKKLEPYDGLKFTAIGGEGKLSSKDFSAISFAAALTPGAFRLGGTVKDFDGNPMSDQDGAQCFATMHTFDLAQADHPRAGIGEKIGGMQYGREQAKEAMEAYAKGDKKPLASILAGGLKYLIRDDKAAEGLSFNQIVRGEMTRRMMEMADRDPELLELVKSPENGLTDQELNYTRSMIRAARICSSAEQAEEKIKAAAATGQNLTDAEKEKILTDLLIYAKLDGAVREESTKASKNPECAAKIDTLTNEFVQHTMRLDNKREKGELTMEQYRELTTPAANILAYRQMMITAEYKKVSPLYGTLYRRQTADELKNYAKEKLKGVDLSQIAPGQLQQAAKNLAAGKPAVPPQPQRGAAAMHS